MPKQITIPRSLFLLLVAAPLLLGARAMTDHSKARSFVPGIFSAGNRILDDKQRDFDVIRVDGDWAQIKLRAYGTVLSPGGNREVWLHIPTNNVYTQQ